MSFIKKILITSMTGQWRTYRGEKLIVVKFYYQRTLIEIIILNASEHLCLMRLYRQIHILPLISLYEERHLLQVVCLLSLFPFPLRLSISFIPLSHSQSLPLLLFPCYFAAFSTTNIFCLSFYSFHLSFLPLSLA